jgi:chromatin remodeling complex protein RSC6
MVIRKKATSKAPKKTTKRPTAKKAAFGGYKINFKGTTHSLENVFGTQPIAPSEMTKKLWAYVKKHQLSSK